MTREPKRGDHELAFDIDIKQEENGMADVENVGRWGLRPFGGGVKKMKDTDLEAAEEALLELDATDEEIEAAKKRADARFADPKAVDYYLTEHRAKKDAAKAKKLYLPEVIAEMRKPTKQEVFMEKVTEGMKLTDEEKARAEYNSPEAVAARKKAALEARAKQRKQEGFGGGSDNWSI